MEAPPEVHTEEPLRWEPLPGRRESLLALDRKIPTMQQKTRTDMHGIAQIWQPSDFLPDFTEQDLAFEKIRTIQRQARLLPPELLIVLIGDTVTEDGLPIFTSRLFTIYGLPTGGQSDVHAHHGNLQGWFGKWTAEEHRHGQVLNTFLRCTGRVNMQAYERTVQLFLEDGMDIGAGNDPYRGFVYTAFQELATQRSHMNVAKLAKNHGNPLLAEICGQVAADEGYHARAYTEFVRTFFERDPNGMMQALSDMLERGIMMPAHKMREVDPSGKVLQPGETYEYFSHVAQKLGIYTAKDYAEISGDLLQAWNVGQKTGTTWGALPFPGLQAEGMEAQQKVLRRQRLIERLASGNRQKEFSPREVSWLLSPSAPPCSGTTRPSIL